MSAKTIPLLAIAAAMIAVVVWQRTAMNRVQSQNAQLRRQIEAVPQPAPPPVAPDNTLNDAERTELLRLRADVAQLRRERDDISRRLTAQTNTVKRAVTEGGADQTWVTQMLNAPAAQQGATAGALRGKLLRGDTNFTPSELALRDAMTQRGMNSLEKTPGEFADFQSAFIESAVGLTDADKTRQIRDIILRTYERAVATGLDIPSKPAAGAEDWVNQRHQLDRRSTSAVQKLLTQEERQAFDRAFIGVMGIDLGTGVDKSNYPPGFLGN